MRLNACVVVVAHGSSRREHSELVEWVVRELSRRLDSRVWLGYLEGREHGLKSIPEAVCEAINSGCVNLIIAPFFLTPGRHVLEDIPHEVSEAVSECGGGRVKYVITDCLGRHAGVVDLLIDNIMVGAGKLDER